MVCQRKDKDIVGKGALLATLLVAMSMSVAQQQASAQQSVEEFLKPTTNYWGAIDNKGPTTGSPANPAVPYTRTCKQTDARTIKCTTIVASQPSGGGKWFSEQYWVAAAPAPSGYKYQSASFSLPRRNESGNKMPAIDWCYGDDNSPMQTGDPSFAWMNHKNGPDHAYAACFIQREDANGPKWIYTFQGQEGKCGLDFNRHDVLASYSCGANGTVVEAAELDVVYVAVK
jgi:hypothetical protein